MSGAVQVAWPMRGEGRAKSGTRKRKKWASQLWTRPREKITSMCSRNCSSTQWQAVCTYRGKKGVEGQDFRHPRIKSGRRGRLRGHAGILALLFSPLSFPSFPSPRLVFLFPLFLCFFPSLGFVPWVCPSGFSRRGVQGGPGLSATTHREYWLFAGHAGRLVLLVFWFLFGGLFPPGLDSSRWPCAWTACVAWSVKTNLRHS